MADEDFIQTLRKRVQFWQFTLHELGLTGWEIDRITLTDAPFGSPDANAAVMPHHTYDRVSFEFNHHVEDFQPSELDRTIVHEWLHVAMRDFDQAVDEAEDSLAPAAAEMWEARVKHEREGVVDRMAWLLVQLADES